MRTRRSKASPTSLITRTTCRICGSPHLAPVLSLGDHHMAGAFADPGSTAPISRRVPLELVRCDTTRDQDAGPAADQAHGAGRDPLPLLLV